MIKGMSRGCLSVILTIVGVVLIFVVLVFVTGWGQRLTASFRGETSSIERTEANAAFRIGTYEEFFQLCESVQNAEGQIRSLDEELETDPSESRVERIQSSLSAIRSTRESSINEYNSKAAQEHKEAFRDASLPERLDRENMETECV